MRALVVRLCLVAALGTLAACAGSGPPDAVHVALSADGRLNPDIHGTPVPTQVRLYVLNDPDKFVTTDYFQLVDAEKESLGATVVASDLVTLSPNGRRTVDLKGGPGAKVLGVAVSYRTIDRATWRVTLPLPSNGRVTARLTADKITLVPGG